MVLAKRSSNLTTKNHFPELLVSIVFFEVVPLGTYTTMTAFLEVLECDCAEELLRFCLDVLNRVKTTPFQPEFHFGEQEKAAG